MVVNVVMPSWDDRAVSESVGADKGARSSTAQNAPRTKDKRSWIGRATPVDDTRDVGDGAYATSTAVRAAWECTDTGADEVSDESAWPWSCAIVWITGLELCCDTVLLATLKTQSQRWRGTVFRDKRKQRTVSKGVMVQVGIATRNWGHWGDLRASWRCEWSKSNKQELTGISRIRL